MTASSNRAWAASSPRAARQSSVNSAGSLITRVQVWLLVKAVAR